MYQVEPKEDLTQPNVYRTDEKYYKQLKKFDNIQGLITLKESEARLTEQGISRRIMETKDGKKLEVFEFAFPEGFIVIKDYLPLKQQVELALLSLNEFVG